MDFDQIVAKYSGELYQAHLGLLFLVCFFILSFLQLLNCNIAYILLPYKTDIIIYLSVDLF